MAQYTCSSHTANLLAKDVTDKELTNKVTTVLKEFKHTDFETIIIQKGGHRIRLPSDTRWGSYRDSYLSFLNNLQYMKEIAGNSKLKKNQARSLTTAFR
jgi:hypothetical protein